jgi:hypothetical protein
VFREVLKSQRLPVYLLLVVYGRPGKYLRPVRAPKMTTLKEAIPQVLTFRKEDVFTKNYRLIQGTNHERLR